jgi:hypothetical protein
LAENAVWFEVGMLVEPVLPAPNLKPESAPIAMAAAVAVSARQI